MSLVIDDGVPSRGHRNNIFNIDFNLVGSALSKHKVYNWCCVIDFSKEIIDHRNILSENCRCFIQERGDTTPEFMRMIESIPNGREILEFTKSELLEGASIELEYFVHECKAKLTSTILDVNTRTQKKRFYESSWSK